MSFGRTTPGTGHPDFGPWVEMLAVLSDKNDRLGELVARRWPRRNGAALLSALESERSRIARELHSGAGQPLAGIKLHLEALGQSLGETADSRPEASKLTIQRIQNLADQALGQVRAVSHRLHPPDWQEMKMEEAVRFLVEQSGLPGSIHLTCSFPPLPEEPSHNVKVQTYRCAQECISNIIRHSGATEASISLEAEEGKLVLTISDNGHGFNPKGRGAGIGLRAITENAASLGGNSRVTTSPNGTKIVVSLPFAED